MLDKEVPNNPTDNKIKRLRCSKNISQDDFGKLIGVDRRTISKYEKCNVTKIPYTKLCMIAHALETTPECLLGRENGYNQATLVSEPVQRVFYKKLLYYMKEKGVDRKKLSRETGISYHTITAWCEGRRFPRNAQLSILTNYFGVSAGELTGIDEMNSIFQHSRKAVVLRVVKRMNNDEAFLKTVDTINKLTPEQFSELNQFLFKTNQ